MDALVIACMTRDHANLLNNQSARSENSRYDLQNKLRHKEKESWFDKKQNKQVEKYVFKEFIKPWNSFTIDAKNELEQIIVSFKQNLRVINKATNYYEKWIEKGGKKVKERIKQEGHNWAIRKIMHEETVSGKVILPWYKAKEGNFTTATRKFVDKTFDLDKIEKITDKVIQNILRNYLTQEKFKEINKQGEIIYNSEIAFSHEGIEELNKNIQKFNNGKNHRPIYKVRIFEEGSGRFILGEKGYKRKKLVQGAPNLFFAVYENKDTKENIYETIPLSHVIEHQKQDMYLSKNDRTSIPIKNILKLKNGEIEVDYRYSLSPFDLVYVPTDEERQSQHEFDFSKISDEQIKRIFNVNDFSGVTCYFTPNRLAKSIYPKEVDMKYNAEKKKTSGSYDTKTASFEGNQIKDVCIKLKIDRLGNIIEVNNQKIK